MFLEGLILGTHLLSVHSAPGFNNTNPGVYVSTPSGWTAGTYYNSERHQSYYVGRTFRVAGPLDVTVGGITGYEKDDVLPMAVPTLRLGKLGQWTPRLAYVPKIEKGGAHVLHSMIERQF